MWSLLKMSMISLFLKNLNKLMIMLSLLTILCSKWLYMPFSYLMGKHSHFIFSDNFSILLVLLSIWMTLCMLLAMNKSSNKTFLYFKFNILNLILMSSFLVKDFVAFFMFFELSLMPTLIMILSWGVQPERIRAGSYLMIYTVMGAMPLLMSIIFNFYVSGTTCMYYFSPFHYTFLVWWDSSWFVLFWMLGFVMKLPMYGVHLWLPKAHVESPVSGSMMLAGVLLKLGAYGMFRMMYFCNMTISWWSNFIYMWLLITMCMVGLMCFRQSDLKSLVAYSSVAHMSLVMLGFYACDYVGQMGVLGMLVAHGVCSSGLFFGVQCFYQLSGSRSMMLNRGFIHLSPILCFFWLMLCVANASAPPSLNLVSEFFLISSILKYSKVGSLFCFLSVFLAGLFSIYLYVLMGHGKWKVLKNYWGNLSARHYLILLYHSMPIYSLILLSNFMNI